MLPVLPGLEIAEAAVDWAQAWRIIASRFPPIHLFERVSPNPAVWEALIELEELTNPRVRDQVGQISLVPPERRISGINASWVMASFTHVNPKGSRFSDGTYGVYYAADSLQTAIAETVHHFAAFARDANDPPRREDMRVLVGTISNRLHDVETLRPEEHRAAVMDPSSYEASQTLARSLREQHSNGLLYPSVRHRHGHCVVAFWPDVVGIPRQERHLQYEWNGQSVTRYFDYSRSEWLPMPADA
jgi:RES domain-containing protein